MFVLAAVRIVVPDIGDSFSPTSAPEMIAPADIGSEIPRPWATPIKASPTVPAVPHEVPIVKQMHRQIMNESGRKICGLISLIP